MPPGPFDALSSLHPLDATAFSAGHLARDPAGDQSFAQHFQAPATSPRENVRNTDKPAPPSTPTPRDAERAPASQSTEPPTRQEQSIRTDASGEQPAESVAAEGQNSETKQESQPETPVAAEAMTKEGTAEEAIEEQEESLDGDELLLTAVAEAPVPATPVSVEKEEAAETAEAIDPLAEVTASPEKSQPHAAKKTPTDAGKLAADKKLSLPQQKEILANADVEATANATTESVEVAAAALPTVDASTADVAPASEQTGGTPGKTRGQRERDSLELSESTSEKSEGVSGVVEMSGDVSPVDVAPASKGREGKKDRSRSETAASAQAKTEASDSRQATTVATAASAAASTASELAAPVPADANAKDVTPPPPVPTGNASTTPNMTDNGSAVGRLPQHLLARGTARGTGGAAPVTNAEQMRLIQRVAKAFQAAHNGDGELRLRLSPPELGALKLEIKLQSGVMTARVEAETATAKSVILDNLPVLKERLAEQGIQVEKFDVDLMDRQPQQGQSESSPDRQQSSSSRWPSAYRAANEPASTETNTSTSSVARGRANDGGLNVTV